MDVEFCQVLFLHLWRWSFDFYPSFCSHDVSHLLHFVTWCITFVNTEASLHSWNESFLILVFDLLRCSWIWFTNIFIEVFDEDLCSSGILAPFFSLVASFSDFGIWVMLAWRCIWKCSSIWRNLRGCCRLDFVNSLVVRKEIIHQGTCETHWRVTYPHCLIRLVVMV